MWAINRQVTGPAIAAGEIRMSPAAFSALTTGRAAKGDVLAVSRIAAIAAAKRTAEWIPLCHLLLLDEVVVDFETDEAESLVRCRVSVRLCAKTGPEMEALVGAQAGLLTIYDMLKAVDKSMVNWQCSPIGKIRRQKRAL